MYVFSLIKIHQKANSTQIGVPPLSSFSPHPRHTSGLVYSRKNWPEKIIFPKTHFLHFVTRWRKIFKTILFILPEVHIHIHVEIQLKVSIFRFLYLGSIRKLRCFFITGHSSSSKVSSLNSSVGFLSCRIDFFLAEPLTPDDPLLNSHLG